MKAKVRMFDWPDPGVVTVRYGEYNPEEHHVTVPLRVTDGTFTTLEHRGTIYIPGADRIIGEVHLKENDNGDIS